MSEFFAYYLFTFILSQPHMRYFLYLSYDGTNYHGWQIQPNAISIQQRINEALSLLLRTPIEVTGAGRTDTGVHAATMIAHFDILTPISNLQQTVHKLNRILPPDIAINAIRPVKDEAHARFDATSRTYHYHIYTEKSPFHRHYATQIYFHPDFSAMNRAAQYLLEVQDFTSFSKLHTDVKTNICHVTHAEWEEVSPGLWRFEITADRFLRNMVRAIVGTLLEVGRQRIDLEEFRRIVAQRNRQSAGDSVPACALSLVHVTYPENLFLQNAE